MYKGYNLSSSWYDEYYYDEGLILYKENKKHIIRTLESFLNDENILDGSKMQENWFPQIEAEIFISHSHKNEKNAIALSGWLSENFRIKTFIDSCIWGNANELLKLIDDKYCWKPTTETYDYRKRNYSTSHIHMMLSTALSKMIDNTECLFFLNTPESISPSQVKTETISPWIYYEIGLTKIIQINLPERLKKGLITEEEFSSFDGDNTILKSLVIKHEVDLSHLTDITMSNLQHWQRVYSRGNALDKLYELNT